MAHIHQLFSSPVMEVVDSICTSGKSGRGPTICDGVAHVALVRRGCFDYHLGPRTYFADSCTAIVYDEDGEYRSSHPSDQGDDCTIFELEPELMAEMFGVRRKHENVSFQMSPSVQAAHLAVYQLLKSSQDQLLVEEAGLTLVQGVSNQARAPASVDPLETRRRRVVNAVKLVLNEQLDSNIGLGDVARQVGCSPYHMMRLFRAHTGQTLRGYRARLRIAAALDRLADGAEDISELAHDLGFASHSHLTDTFRALLGAKPSDMRDKLRRDDLADKRRMLDAMICAA
jgi:AraC family transcriptional regulator